MMASKQTYPCFVCKKNGFPDVMVYLDGRTADGKTIYKNEDMTPHNPKQQQSHDHQQIETNLNSQPQAQQPKQQEQQKQPTELSLKLIHARIDRVIQLLESQNRMIGLLLDPNQRQKLTEYELEAGK